MSRVFNGTSDLIALGTSVSIDTMISATEFTLVAWVYVTDTNSGNSDVVWEFGGIPGVNGVSLYLNCGPTDGQLNGFVQTVNFDMNCNSTVVSGLAANQWVHVAMTYKDLSIGGDGIAHLYYGGNEVIYAHEIPGTGGLQLTTGQPAFIGTDNSGDFLLGNIAEARAYNVALSAIQIAAIAADTAGSLNAGGAQANLVAYLHLCGTAIPEPDASGDGNSGTLTGTTQGPNSPGFSCGPPPATSMITLTGGNLQDAQGNVIPNASMSLQLNTDCVVIASPGGQVPAQQVSTFQFDSTGNLVQPVRIWSNAELLPKNLNGQPTYYQVIFFDANGARISGASLYWQFTQAGGSTVDIGTIVPYVP
ncbi:MAG: LamG domain-containing protein [Burkholderiales bacterium]